MAVLAVVPVLTDDLFDNTAELSVRSTINGDVGVLVNVSTNAT